MYTCKFLYLQQNNDYIDFDIIRQNFYTASNLKGLFHNIHPKRIIFFVYTPHYLGHDIATMCDLRML